MNIEIKLRSHPVERLQNSILISLKCVYVYTKNIQKEECTLKQYFQ